MTGAMIGLLHDIFNIADRYGLKYYKKDKKHSTPIEYE